MPYGPWNTDHSGELMASGITGGIKDLMQGYVQGQEEKKRLIQGAKASDAMMKTFPELLNSLGMDEHDFAALGANEKIGTAAGAIHGWVEKQRSQTEGLQQDRLRSGIETDKTMQNYHRAQMGMMAERQRAMATQDDEDAAVGEGLRNFALPPPAQVDAGGVKLDASGSFMDRPDTYDAAMKRALATPGLGGRGGGKLAEILLRNQPKPGKTFSAEMQPTNIPGIVLNPNNGYAMRTPATPTKGEGEPQSVTIGGKDTGWALFPDGRYRAIKPKTAMDLSAFDKDEDGVLSAEEFSNAFMAKRTGGAYPGMKLGAGKGSEQKKETKGGGSAPMQMGKEDFQEWLRNRR